MLGAKVGRRTEIEFRIGWDVEKTHTGDGDGYFSTQAAILFENTYNVVLTSSDGLTPAGNKHFISLSGGSTDNPDGTVGTTYTLTAPTLSISDSFFTATPLLTSEATVRMVVRAYFENLVGGRQFVVYIDDLEWFVDGVLQGGWTSGGPFLGSRYEPAGLPFLGVAPYFTGGVTPHFDIAVPPYAYDTETTVAGTVYGGYRLRESGAGSWVEPPVAIQTASYPAISCASTLTADGIVTGTTTWDLALNLSNMVGERGIVAFSLDSPTADQAYYSQSRNRSQSGDYSIVPVWDTNVLRLSEHHGEIVARAGAPYTTIRTDRTCLSPATFPLGTSSEFISEVHPAYFDQVAKVTNAAHPIEDSIAEIPYLIYSAGNGEGVGQWLGIIDLPGQPVTHPPVSTNEDLRGASAGIEFPWRVGHRTLGDSPNLDILAFYDWSDGGDWTTKKHKRVNYTIHLLHPHWRYWSTFQNWVVDGGAVSADKYWKRKGDQFFKHSASPAGDQTRERTSLVSAFLREGPMQDVLLTHIAGEKTSFWGAPDFHRRALTAATSKAAEAGPSRYTLTDCTASYGADIQLTSTGASTIKARYDLASFTQAPYLYPLIAAEFEVGWTPTNITTCEVWLIGADGAEVMLTDTPGTLPWPAEGLTTNKYAGSWGNDFGLGEVVDTGVDLDLTGESAAYFGAGNVQPIAVQLLPGRTAKYLEYRITLTSAGTPVNIDFPVFHAGALPPSVFTETRQYATVAWPSGPAIRWGNTKHADPTTGVVNPPVHADIDKPKTAMDWLVFYNLVFLGEAAGANIGVNVLLLYTPNEEYALGAEENTAIHTIALLRHHADPCAMLLNGWSPPPIAYLPYPKRNEELEPLANEFSMEVYSLADMRRWLIAPASIDPVQLINPLDGLDTLANGAAPNGWQARYHQRALLETTGSETGYIVRWQGFDYAEVRPFSGYFCVLGGSDPVGGSGPFNLHTQFGAYHRAFSNDDGIRYHATPFPQPPFESAVQVTTGGTDTHPRMAESPTGRILLTFHRDGTGAMFAFSDDDGVTFSAPGTLMAGKYFPTIASDQFGGILFAAFAYNSGTSGPGKIYFRRQGPGDSAPGAEFVMDDGATAFEFEPSSFHLSMSEAVTGRWVLTALKSGGSSPTEFASDDDGETWAEL